MTSPPDPAPESGFTLIEIIVVLAILGAMLGLLVSRGPLHSATLDLRAVADGMARTLRGAQAQAIAGDRPVTFTLDAARHVYALDRAAPVAIPAAVGLAMQSAAGEAAGPGQGAISFAPDGSSTGGQIDLTAGTRRMRIGVNWLTGRVSVSDGT